MNVPYLPTKYVRTSYIQRDHLNTRLRSVLLFCCRCYCLFLSLVRWWAAGLAASSSVVLLLDGGGSWWRRTMVWHYTTCIYIRHPLASNDKAIVKESPH